MTGSTGAYFYNFILFVKKNFWCLDSTVEPLLKDSINLGNRWTKDKGLRFQQIYLNTILPLNKDNLCVASENIWL